MLLALGPFLGSTAAQYSVNDDGRRDNEGARKIEPIYDPYQNTPTCIVEHLAISVDPPITSTKGLKVTGGTSGLSKVHLFARPQASARR